MKNVDVYKVAFLILVCVFCYIIIIVITGMVMSKIPTTTDNKEIREQILEMVAGIQSSVTLILGYKLGKATNIKNDI
jgi:cytochrome bd-type quinol oxidase subunit 1